MSPEVLRITVEVTDAGERIAGRVVSEAGEEQPFQGWLALLSELQSAVGQARESDNEPGGPEE